MLSISATLRITRLSECEQQLNLKGQSCLIESRLAHISKQPIHCHHVFNQVGGVHLTAVYNEKLKYNIKRWTPLSNKCFSFIFLFFVFSPQFPVAVPASPVCAHHQRLHHGAATSQSPQPARTPSRGFSITRLHVLSVFNPPPPLHVSHSDPTDMDLVSLAEHLLGLYNQLSAFLEQKLEHTSVSV